MERVAGSALVEDRFGNDLGAEVEQDFHGSALLFRQLRLLCEQVAFFRRLGSKLGGTSGSRDVLGAIAEALLEELPVSQVAIFSLQEGKLILHMLARRGQESRCFAAGVGVSLEPGCVRELVDRGEVTLAGRKVDRSLVELGPGGKNDQMLLLALVAGAGAVGAIGLRTDGHELTGPQRRLLALARPMLEVVVRSSLIKLGLETAEKKDRQEKDFSAAERLELEWGMLVGFSPAFTSLLEKIQAVGRKQGPVLIQGPAGTEKILVAKAIHLGSPFKDGPLLLVNGRNQVGRGGCADDLNAWLRRACGGTLVVSGAENLSSATSSALAEALGGGLIAGEEENGGQAPGRVRLVATTEADQETLANLWGGNSFRLLTSLRIKVPGLEQRACDIPGLASQLLSFFARKHESAPKYLLPEAVTYLIMRPWRGNVHELATVIEKAVVCADGPEVGLSAVVDAVQAAGLKPEPGRDKGMLLRQVIEQTGKGIEAQLITGVLAQTQNNRTRAARMLGIGRRTLLYKLRDLALLPGSGLRGGK